MSDNAMSPSTLDLDAASSYVRALFANVLHRSAKAEELKYWTDFVLSSQDPIDLFHRFCDSVESKNILEQAKLAKTGFPAGHFYSTIPDLAEVRSDRDRIFGKRALLDVDLNVDGQIENLKRISRHWPSMPFSDEKDESRRYHYNNTSFAFGDACFYWGMLSELRPSRIIEIGSGYTSALALDAIESLELDTVCTFIDPYPALLNRVASPIAGRHQVIVSRIQDVDPEIIRTLGRNDVLFIDSSHVVKVGSDVHFELTELLPRLAPGAVVHFHDTFYPFEYPESWVAESNIFWNELYFLHAFLMNNSDFEIILFNDFLGKNHLSVVETVPAKVLARIKLNPGGGLWLRRK